MNGWSKLLHTLFAAVRPGALARHSLVLVVLLAAGLSLVGATVRADSYDERRVRAGVRLFRSLLAADVALPSKAGADGALLVLVYGSDPRLTAEVAELIAPSGGAEQAKIKGLSVAINVVAAVPDTTAPRPAGVFLAVPPTAEELERLIQWAIAERVILYSPFEGHVERGVLGGIAIEAKVLPYLNQATLEASHIELKPFFLKVAKVYR